MNSFKNETLKTVNEVLENPNYEIITKVSDKTGNFLVMYKHVEAEKYSVIDLEKDDTAFIKEVDEMINPKEETKTMTLTEHYNTKFEGRGKEGIYYINLIRKNIICLDGKERVIDIHADGSIEYRLIKDGKWFGRSFYLKLEKLPKWITLEILESIYNDVPKDNKWIQKQGV